VRVLEAAGFDLVLIETVGAGQLQVDVRFVADTVVLALVPEAGDIVQAMKAGIIEIADIYVINKADREGATRMRLDLRNALELGGKPKGWNPPITLTEAIHGKGVDELVEFIEEHKRYQQQSGGWEARRLQHIEWELQSLIHDALEQHARATTQHLFSAETLQAVLQRRGEPLPDASRMEPAWFPSRSGGNLRRGANVNYGGAVGIRFSVSPATPPRTLARRRP
jgi:LAO/AO transport system kinase